MNYLQIRWRHLLALSLILLCSVSALFARPLSEREARHLAEQFFHQVAYAHKVLAPAQQPLSFVSAPIRQSAGVELRTLSGDKARYYYIYNRGSNAGFVIIAGDDELTPYIGYATTGQVLEQDMPEQLRAFLKACQERIDELTSSVGLRSSLRPTPRTATEPAQIAPLLGNIQWNQSAPWNNQTPTDNQGKHMPVGCVATAYTQVMRYHQWPTQGEGTFSYTEERSNRQHSVDYGATTYDWAHMPERYNDPSSATSEETQALSTLAYHAGVAVEMMYAPSGSGSYTPLVARALADHFRYDKRVSFKSRSNYTQSSWEQMLRAELIAARPVVYSGSGSGGGHAFVCDGYDMEGLFHINWGWGGMSDGYFNLNYLVPSDLGIGGGAGGGFSLGQGAVVGIKPDKTGSSQRQESSLVTTWRFGMTFTEGTLDASAEYTVTLTTDATPYDGSVTYGVTKVGTTDTLYLDQYARNARIDGLYQDFSIDPEKLQLSNHIGVGTWDIFLAYRHTDAKGQTAWRPCGQHERAKEQYRHTYTITQESDGSYVVTEEASSNLSMLELVAGSVQSSIVGYEKSKVSLQLRNTGRVEFFDQLYLYARKVGERIFEPVVNIIPAIGAGEVKEVTFEIDRFPYGSGDVELGVGYFIGNRFNQLSTTTVSIQSATDIRPAYVLSSDQPVTVNVNSGNLSQIRIRNIGTKTPTNRVYYRWELRKEKQTASTYWRQIDIPAGGEQLVAPNLAGELRQIGAKRGDNITLTATFLEVNNEERRIISVIPLMEEPKLSVYCDGEPVVGDGVITMTTARAVGKNISFAYFAEGDVVIEGATGTPKEKKWIDYTLTSQQVSLRGDITELACMENELTNLDVSQCSSLKYLICYKNQIKGEAMTQLVNSLPDRTGKEAGGFAVYSHFQEERNRCLKSDVAIAKAKNWEVYLAAIVNGELKYYLYEGEDDSQPSVGDGVITMTTSREVGQQIMLAMSPVEGQTVIAEGLKEPLILDGTGHFYTLTSQMVTLRGNLTFLKCKGNLSRPPVPYRNYLTSLDVSRCNTLTKLDCSENSLQSLDVSGCNALTVLDCSENSLQSLDVSGCNTLSELYCYYNSLQSLDVSSCNALTVLYCSGNSLQSLDITHNEALTKLSCWGNQLETLDLSQCLNLVNVDLAKNQLTHLDVSHNGELQFLECYDNQIKGEAMTALVNGLPSRIGKDPHGQFVVVGEDAKTDGNICLKSDVAIAKAKNWSVEDENGGPYEGENDSQPSVGDGVITMTTSRAVGEQIMLAMSPVEGQTVIAEGLKESLILDGRGHLYTLTSQTVTLQGNLTLLDCGGPFFQSGESPITYQNQLTSLDVSRCNTLTVLNCSGNLLQSLDITHNEALTDLYCSNNQLETLDLSHARALEDLDGANIRLTDLDLSQCLNLRYLNLSNNQLTSLDVSHNPNLKVLFCDGNPIERERMTQLVKTLSDRTGLEEGTFVPGECLKSDVAIANAKNWKVNDEYGDPYEGEDDSQPSVGDGVITMTTSRAVGEQIMLAVRPVKGQTVIAEGLKESLILDGKGHLYTLTSQTVTLRGNLTLLWCDGAVDLETPPSHENQLTSLDINCETLTRLFCSGNQLTSLDLSHARALTTLVCYENKLTQLDLSPCTKLIGLGVGENQLTHLDVSHNGELQVLDCYGNQIKGEAMTELVNGLPNRMGKAPGKFRVIGMDAKTDGNICLKSDVAIAKGKNWSIHSFSGDYKGEDPTYSVTLTKEGEGTLTVTGVDNLDAVPYDTELTIVATPAEGYELTALTANGTDILATKKFVVKGATAVKATFTKKNFAVSLTKEGEGMITATGTSNLNSVAYGTELTIVATPAEGYELTALTANGTDILATKKFVVKGATEVKATFAKKSFAVSLTKEGKGTLTATGADNLTAVPYGTELTIVATPAEGYELTALTANGTDILATKKFVVKGATEVKATFTKKSFAVTLTSNEHGTISIVENVDLKAVPYGTTLTVQATGKNDQCELTALTANGEDILATKQFVVKGATEVKATFVDHTGVETTVTQQVKLYPNPATEYVIVEGIAPASEVMLHSMTGELLCAMQADAEGHLQIDLTALSDGVYLLVSTGWQERLVVKK
ncbi:C10 family peptidase [Porphyromonas uenonis]|uniref:C10 family peptidase n=1 Tax=Porphyromonas uenonis TaxID=281920 RepID=UPI0034E9837A